MQHLNGKMHSDHVLHHTKGVVGISVCATWSSSVLCLCRCTIMRGGMEQYLTPMGPTKLHVNPIFEISPLEPHFSEWLVFEGLSIDEFGRQHYLDASVAYKRAVLNCIHYLAKFGYTKQQASFTSHNLHRSALTHIGRCKYLAAAQML